MNNPPDHNPAMLPEQTQIETVTELFDIFGPAVEEMIVYGVIKAGIALTLLNGGILFIFYALIQN